MNYSYIKRHLGALLGLLLCSVFPAYAISQAQLDDACIGSKSNAAAFEKCLMVSPSQYMATDYTAQDRAIASTYLNAAVNTNGNFTCGIPNGAILLYGHPYPGTSGTTIRVDGVDHWDYGSASFGTQVTAPTNINATTSQGVWDIGDIRVTQNLQIVNGSSGHADTLRISYTLNNRGTASHSVGVRVMLDTMLGSNDGAPFRIPSIGDVTYGLEFNGASVPVYWEAFESLQNANGVRARGTLLDNGVRPDRVVFTYWGHINDTPWDFVTNTSEPVTGDSAVGIYWNPVTLAAGQSLTRSTYYGIGDILVSGSLALSAPAITDVNGSYSPNPFPLTVYVSNTGSVALTGLNATLTLPAGLALASGSLTQGVPSVTPGTTEQVTWLVNITGTATGILAYSASVVGTSFSAQSVSDSIIVPVLSPIVSTDAPSVITPTTARINGTVSPGSADTTVSFDYGLTTSYGTSIAATPGIISAGAGITHVTANLASLTCNTAYHYRVKAVNSAGTKLGNDTTFTTSACTVTLPTSTSSSATGITATGATLNGSVTPNGGVTAVSFDFGPTTSYGSSVIATPGTIAANAGATVVTANTTGLTCNTTYNYRVKAVNSAGTTYGANSSFTTSACAPSTSASSVTGITATGATLNGSVTSNGAVTTVSFDFGLTTSYGTSIAATPGTIAANAVATVVTASTTGLTCNTTYNYRVKAVSSAGTTYGVNSSFTTSACAPSTASSSATGVTGTSAILNGSVTPNGGLTTVSFDFGLTTSYGTSVIAAPGTIAANAGATVVTASTTGLTCNTTYNYRVKAVNSGGTTYGANSSFTTNACAPSTTASSATGITTTSATLNGSVNSNGAVTTVSFDFGLTTSYGTSVVATPSTIAANAGATFVTASKTGLTCNTIYNYRVKAVNSAGTVYSANATFTTSACPTDLALTLNDGLSRVNAGDTTTYVIKVTNAGPSSADNAVLTASAVANLTNVSATCGSVTGGAICPTGPIAIQGGAMRLTIPTLPSLSSLTFTVRATISATATSGTLAYTATVTAPSGVVDSNTANNTATDTDGIVGRPDFVITNVAINPGSPIANGVFSVAVTIKNNGSVVAATGAKLSIWLDHPGSPIACGTAGDTWADVGSLAAGATKVVTFSNLAAGAWGGKTLRVFVDSTCIRAESNENNNQVASGYWVSGVPDLVVTSVALNPATPAANGMFTATVVVKNQGNVDADGAYLDVWSDQATAKACGSEGDDWADISNLAAGASVVITVNLPAGAAGTKTLRAFVDSWCEIAESNEDNNQLTKTYTTQ